MRLIRLYPLIFLAVTIGAIHNLVKGFLLGGISNLEILHKYFLTLLLIPNSLFGENIFPLNGPLWSLFFEFFAYICFATFLYRLSNYWLVFIVLIAFTGFSYWVFINFGLNFSETGHYQFFEGFLRVTFAFPLGVLLFRVQQNFRYKSQTVFVILLLSFVFTLSLPRNYFPFFFYLCAFVLIFPSLILIGKNVLLPKGLHGVMRFLGDISYPVYVIHLPVMWGVRFLVNKLFGMDSASWSGAGIVYLGLIVIPTVILISFLILKLYDEPTRAYLKNKLFSSI